MRNVTVTLRDATIQAYLTGSNFSKEGRTLPVAPVPRPSSVRASVASSLRETCAGERSCSRGLGAAHTLTCPRDMLSSGREVPDLCRGGGANPDFKRVKGQSS